MRFGDLVLRLGFAAAMAVGIACGQVPRGEEFVDSEPKRAVIAAIEKLAA